MGKGRRATRQHRKYHRGAVAASMSSRCAANLTHPCVCRPRALSRKTPHHDGFPSPVGSPGPGSFTVQRAAGETVEDTAFMATALGETGTNPYTVSGWPAGGELAGSWQGAGRELAGS